MAAGELVMIAAIIVIPLVLLGFLFAYLRRTAPGGTVPVQAEARPEATATSAVEGPGARVKGAVVCKSCGMATTAIRVGGGATPRCGNCNTMLIVS